MKIQSSELYVNNKKVYHEGNKPRPQDINAADRNHSHGEYLKNGSTTGTLYVNDWFRANGSSGIYFQTHGGGWHMTDSTWLRAYNNKSIYTSGELRAEKGLTTGNLKLTAASSTGEAKIQTQKGYVSIGPQNADYCHYSTDRPSHWFNKTVKVNGEIYVGGNYNQRVYHQGFKPSAADINAADRNHSHNNYLPLTGGIVTGKLQVEDTLKAYVYRKSNNKAALTIDKIGNGCLGIGGNGKPMEIQYGQVVNMDGAWDGSQGITHNFKGDLEVNDQQVYHKGRKPSPEEIGARSKSSDGYIHAVNGGSSLIVDLGGLGTGAFLITFGFNHNPGGSGWYWSGYTAIVQVRAGWIRNQVQHTVSYMLLGANGSGGVLGNNSFKIMYAINGTTEKPVGDSSSIHIRLEDLHVPAMDSIIKTFRGKAIFLYDL